ncbi:polysaccharide biosynthesis protein [Rhizobacter sp. LjRoot28]|uniref:polysaccharide biosynthesis protein n=1 Tax=Rhizobacter sp. LjRoot28 TaxID=3342309 RepID=UPI003ECCF5C8
MTSTRKLAIMIGGDAIFLPLCMIAAVGVRLGSLQQALQNELGLQILIGLLTLPVLGAAGLYRTVVRYIDLRVLFASSASLAVVVLAMFGLAMAFDVHLLPRSSLLMYWFVAFTYVVISRFMARSLLLQGFKRSNRSRVRTAIYGAGEAGAQLAHTMQVSREYQAVCFLDDRLSLHNKSIAGLRVHAPSQLHELIDRLDISQVVVAIPSATRAQKRELLARLQPTGLPIKILPGLVDLVKHGHVAESDLREVEVSDLLGRDPVPPQPQLFSRNITGKVVLVTGAGGSIGSELCRQIASQNPRRLVLFDHSEYALYAIDQELRRHAPDLSIEPVLGTVLDEQLLARVFMENRVGTVYHAAAYKHVPIVESNMQQGLRNNVLGSRAVARAAIAAGVETCVLVSTDKAVRPTNVMGASKRTAELVFQAAAQRAGSRTCFSMVRFGNVLGSSGSVVPLFKQQIQAGGPITITHPDIIRYFMLIPEAAQLVIQAGALAKGGEVFVLDMGEPVRIVDLARSMIRLSGLSERTEEDGDGDIEIQFVGLRPGEKLYEELLIGDNVRPSEHSRIMCAHERYIEPALLDKMIDSLQAACDVNDVDGMLRQLENLVPEYVSSVEINGRAANNRGQR